MGGKLNVYDWASKGVNTTEDPIHLTDGELVQAQNVQLDPVLKRGALRRRDGLTKVNSIALAGAVSGLCPLPLPDLSALTRYFYAAWDDVAVPSANTFRISSLGGWANFTTAAKPAEQLRIGSVIGIAYLPPRYVSLRQ